MGEFVEQLLSARVLDQLRGAQAQHVFVGCRPRHPINIARCEPTLRKLRRHLARDVDRELRLEVIDAPGPLTVETVNSADFAPPRSGLINLDHKKAVAAGLKNGDEPAHIYFHVIRHPRFGTFIVDTGVERAIRDSPDDSALDGVVGSAMNMDRWKVRVALGDWLVHEKLKGVFLTHIHPDHVAGMPDVPRGTPIYTGPGEAGHRGFKSMLMRRAMDRAFDGQAAISELQFKSDPDRRFDGVLDVFGDGSLWAILTPGHTPGSISFVARTKSGPVLLTGDVSHTAWGWKNGVEPGSYTDDRDATVMSLQKLRELAAEHPQMSVRLGHQVL